MTTPNGGQAQPAERQADAPAADPPRRRLVALDGVRFLAAISVVAAHFIGLGAPAWHHSTRAMFGHLQFASAYGILGVELFFLVSGFVICMSSWGRTLGDFFVSRVVRLYPGYWAAIGLVAVVVYFWPPDTGRLPLAAVLANFTMFNVALHAPNVTIVVWTLWQEMKFYLLFSVVIWRGLTYRRVVYFCVLWLAASLVATGTNSEALKFVFQPEFSMYFVAGIALYLIYRHRSTVLLWGMVAACWLLAEYEVTGRIRDNAAAMERPGLPWWPAAILITVFFGLLAAIALGRLDWVRGRWITTLGALTYPLYLVHHEVGLTIIANLSGRVPRWPLLLGTVAVVLLVAYLIHRLVEKPFAPLLKRALRRGLNEMNAADRRLPAVEAVPVPRKRLEATTPTPAPAPAPAPTLATPLETELAEGVVVS